MKGKKKKIILDLDIIFVSCVKLLLFVVSLLCFFDKKNYVYYVEFGTLKWMNVFLVCAGL